MVQLKPASLFGSLIQLPAIQPSLPPAGVLFIFAPLARFYPLVGQHPPFLKTDCLRPCPLPDRWCLPPLKGTSSNLPRNWTSACSPLGRFPRWMSNCLQGGFFTLGCLLAFHLRSVPPWSPQKAHVVGSGFWAHISRIFPSTDNYVWIGIPFARPWKSYRSNFYRLITLYVPLASALGSVRTWSPWLLCIRPGMSKRWWPYSDLL